MKTYIFAAIALLPACLPDTLRAQEQTDTTSVQVTDSTVVVTSEHRLSDIDFQLPLSVRISDKKEQGDGTASSHGNKLTSTALRIGQANAIGSQVNTTFGQSWEFALECLEIHHTIAPHWHVNYGLWLNWRNYRLTGKQQFTFADDGSLVLAPYPEGSHPKFSRIKIYSMEVPLTATYSINGKIDVDFGPIFSFNRRTSVKTRYDLDGKGKKDYHQGIHANRFTIDLLAQVRYGELGLYFKYSPMDVLNKDWAPRFHGFSTGLCLFY